MGYEKHCLTFNVTVYFVIGFSTISISAEKLHNATLTNLLKCKLTHLGTEYMGFASTTAGGIRCQMWHSEQPLHKVSEDIKDTDFPERSIILAKSYCRNPTKDSRGPWCYTMEPSLIDDACEIPLCNYGECRISGTGAEYGGSHKTSSSGKKCKSWNKHHKLANTKTEKFPNNRFPDLSRAKAKSFCRNPDDSIGGPWCYVEEDNYEIVTMEYCDVPFCDDKDCLVYARNASVYSTLTGLNSTLGNITFWIKLWNPIDEQKGEARLLLSLLPIPTTAKSIAQEWRAGVEIVISNAGSGQMYPNSDEEHDFENTPNIILGSKWTALWATWGGGFISVGLYGSSKPLFMDEYKKKESIANLYPDNFLYYGLMGTGVLWSMEFCEESCEVHTTFGMEFLRVWPLIQSNNSYELHFYVRASHNIAVQLYHSPGAPFPCFTLMIGHANTTILLYQEDEKSMKQYLKDVPTKDLLNFWTWKEFTLSIFGSHLRLFTQHFYGSEQVLDFSHPLFDSLRWFSAGSEQNVAHWTFSCEPGESDAVEEPWPPNCMINPSDFKYEGSQWTSANEMPCIPWISKEIPEDQRRDDLFADGSAVKALNKCRNPVQDSEGPFCFAISSPQDFNISKQYCPIRKCRSSECRMTGTANDYIGTLSTTRSGRTCAKWLSDYDLEKMIRANKSREAGESTMKNNVTIDKENVESFDSSIGGSSSLNMNKIISSISRIKTTTSRSSSKLPPKPMHTVNPAYFNDSLYPERSVINASNFCRDPSRNIAGTWCYTTDPLVPQDLCNVRDCTKPEECTFLVKGHGITRRLYILPEYRSEGLHFSLKIWEADHPDSITFGFMADEGLKSRYILKVSSVNNEKVLLYYQSEEEGIKLVKKKTLPRLLYIGKWSSFVIRIPRGRIEMYYEGASTPLFEWQHPEPAKAFLPIYYYYTSELDYTIGVAFDCNARCHIENTMTDRFTRILPLSVRRTDETANPDRLVLMIRAKGVVLIPLLLLPTTPGYYGLTVGELGQWILFLKNTYPVVRIFHKQKAPGPLFTTNTWTNITIRWYNHTIKVLCNDTEVFHYEHPSPLLFYFFSLAVEIGGWATWTANCLPADIDGEPEDGGWSEWGPWMCSASCNGGTGTRKRLCNSPEPNVKGEPCLGPSVMSGRCNTNICGDIIEDTIKLIRRRIGRNHTALTVMEGKAITIPSDPDIIAPVTIESPSSEINWSRNGIFLQEEKYRVEIKNYDVVISRAILNDSGVYTITLHRIDGSHMIFKIVTLAVQPVKDIIIIRETLPFSVTCHCIALGYVYSDLKVSWMINERLWKDYGTTLPIAVNVDHISAANGSHKGTWRCTVEQNDLDFKWTTNMMTVEVIGAPNWRTHLMEDKLTRPIFGWMPNEGFVAVSAFILLLMIVSCIIAATVSFLRFQNSLKFDESGDNRDSSLGGLTRRAMKMLNFEPPRRVSKNEVDDALIHDELENKELPDSSKHKFSSVEKIEEERISKEQETSRIKYEAAEKSKDIEAVPDDVVVDDKNSSKYKRQEMFKSIKDSASKKIENYSEESSQSENEKSTSESKRKFSRKSRSSPNEGSSNESEYWSVMERFISRAREKMKMGKDEDANGQSENESLFDKLRLKIREKRKRRKLEKTGSKSENQKLIVNSDAEE